MADHINISAPRQRYELEDRLQRERMQTELKVLQEAYDGLARDMDAIFTRIARGEQAELHYPDGQVSRYRVQVALLTADAAEEFTGQRISHAAGHAKVELLAWRDRSEGWLR